MKPSVSLSALLMVLMVSAAAAETYWWHFKHEDCLHMDVKNAMTKDIPTLEKLCASTEGCVGFNTDGWLKNSQCTPQTMTVQDACDLYFLEDTPQHSPTPTPTPVPVVWPQPKSFTSGNSLVSMDSTTFTFTAVPAFNDINNAIARYSSLIFSHPPSKRVSRPADAVMLTGLTIHVANPTAPLQLYTNESYSLVVSDQGGVATLTAETYYGALRGLETFSQMSVYNFETRLYDIPSAPWTVDDEPRFTHRGILVDSSRHFEPVKSIKHILDGMSYTKLNVMHWHIVDEQSFPAESPSNPKLWDGSWSLFERFTVEDMEDIVEYARQRGIRVMPEADTPGHAAAWCTGYPEICPSSTCLMPLNPATNATFDLIDGLFSDWTGGKTGSGIFPENLLHLGGDEVNTDCWARTPSVAAWLKEKNFTTDDAYEYFVDRVHTIALDQGRQPVNWEEVWNHFGTKLDKRSIIHIWLNKATLKDVVSNGYRGILSDNNLWYLDHLDITWDQMYLNEPFSMGIDDPAQQALVLGGETEMWGETADESDVVQTIFPRAAAVAERLWSPRNVNSTAEALPRLHWFRCLLNRRGIEAAPVINPVARSAPGGPGACLTQ